MMFIINSLAIIGAMFLLHFIIIPLTKGAMFALGYTIFEAWKWNIKKVAKHPGIACKQTAINFITGFFMFFDYGVTQCITSGNKQWEPYFKYSRGDKE